MILDTDKLQSDAAYREDMRHRFVTDHFFAAKVIGFQDFSERAHGPAVRLYGPKVKGLPITRQPRKKRLIHLDPRHTFKTTLKRVDRAQWICAFPEEVTILNNSATQPLAEAVSLATANLFYQPKGEAATTFQLIWPELVTQVDPSKSPNKAKWLWNTVNRRRSGPGDIEGTLAYTSPQSSQSGWHPMIMDYDDVEDAENSGITANDDVRQNVIDKCNQNGNLLRAGGWVNIGGTTYHPFDWYSQQLALAKKFPDEYEVLVRASLRVKNGTRLVPGEFPKEEDIELLWPEYENLTYRNLERLFYENYESFMCQQQNDPQGGAVPTFDEKLYASCLIAPERLPMMHLGETFICWRPRYGGRKGMAKYIEGAAARIVDGRVYVIDCWQGTYTPSGEAERMVAAHKQHQADGMMILGTPGSDYMFAHVRNEAAKRNVSVRIQWVDWEENEDRQKANIQRLEPMMRTGRILFSTAMTKSQECHKQFVHFGLVEENGIAECVSQFADMVPISQMRANMQEEELEYQRRNHENAMIGHFLQQQGMPEANEQLRQKTTAHLDAMAATTTFGMPSLPGGLDG